MELVLDSTSRCLSPTVLLHVRKLQVSSRRILCLAEGPCTFGRVFSATSWRTGEQQQHLRGARPGAPG